MSSLNLLPQVIDIRQTEWEFVFIKYCKFQSKYIFQIGRGMSRDVKTNFTKTKIKCFKEMLGSAKLSNQYLESILK